MSEIVVVGGGISGLASAWFLRERGHRVRVLEAGDRPGGCLRTVAGDGFLVEAGPNSTLSKGGPFDELVRGVGLADEMIEANALAKRRYVVKHGRPVALPGNPPAFFATRLFSARAKLRLLAEPFVGRANEEETVAQFVRRRLGQEFLDRAVDPFVSGVYAGDPEKLSVRAATAKIWALEDRHGSLIRGALAQALRGRASGPQPRGRLVSFGSGMQSLPAAIAARLGEAVELGAPVVGLDRTGAGRWQVRTAARSVEADGVVLSTAADAAARLTEPLDAGLAAELRAVSYPPVLSVALGYARAQVAHPLDGFGMLIPRREGRSPLGALFSSTLFAGRAPAGQVLLTAFAGGARNPAVAEWDDDDAVARITADLRDLLGIAGDPGFTMVHRWPRAIPQYEIGHLDRLARIDAALARLPGLCTRANWRDGISVFDCVANAHAFAQRFA
jgi:oxygen-dependent protoporphyrinogen oxidase